jgi:hypothetical protein
MGELMDEAKLKLEARLTAIEYLLSDLFVKWYAINGATNARIAEARADTANHLKTQTFPGVDPAMSDLFAAEFEEAVSAILLMQRQMLANLNAKLGRP